MFTPRKEIYLPSLSLGLTQQEYRQIRTPLAPSTAQTEVVSAGSNTVFTEATRLSKVGLPELGIDFSDSTSLAISPKLTGGEGVEDETHLVTVQTFEIGNTLDFTREVQDVSSGEETIFKKGDNHEPNSP